MFQISKVYPTITFYEANRVFRYTQLANENNLQSNRAVIENTQRIPSSSGSGPQASTQSNPFGSHSTGNFLEVAAIEEDEGEEKEEDT